MQFFQSSVLVLLVQLVVVSSDPMGFEDSSDFYFSELSFDKEDDFYSHHNSTFHYHNSTHSATLHFSFETYVACKGKKNATPTAEAGEHPNQCGEDSFFLTPEENTFGIADGVGGWNNENVDPSQISRSLMLNAQMQATFHDSKPQAILKSAYNLTLEDPEVEAGSTTACIIQFMENDIGQPVLVYANLGDSGFVVIRDGHDVIFRSEFQMYGNAPYQLAKIPTRFKGQNKIESQPEEADVGTLTLQDGDIVILGTDGVWDNFAPDLHDHSCYDIESLTRALTCNEDNNMASNILDVSLRHNIKPDDITVMVTQISYK